MAWLPKLKYNLAAGLLGGLILALLGATLANFRIGASVARFSYDAPFWFHRSTPRGDVALVCVDESTVEKYSPGAFVLDRRVQARLLRKLTAEGARLVFYDFAFDTPSADPQADAEFADAMRKQGSVVLGAFYGEQAGPGGVLTQAIPPTPALLNAAKGWGLLYVLEDSEQDNTAREICRGSEHDPNAPWVAAQILNAPVTKNPNDRTVERWLDYYGPPGTNGVFAVCSFEAALEPNGMPAGFFHDKIVIVCPHSVIAGVGGKADEFLTPYSRVGHSAAMGAEIHATALLNLLHGQWLTRMHLRWQTLLVIGLGLGVGMALTPKRPWHAVWIAAVWMLVVAALSFYLHFSRGVWWSWAIPAMVQIPIALVWSIGAQYLTEARQRLRLRRAFGAYLSPRMAEQVAESDFDLSLGGKEVEATVMFTDVQDFTKISESMKPPELSTLLTTYFEHTSRTILDKNGTIIKYLGDGIMAVWGAPVPDAKQAENAVLAAWQMVQSGRQQIAGYNLRTRIGINSGSALAGNLGSSVRFDYTVIGDTTNYASRLEGFNKYFRTEILISDATRSQLSNEIKVRSLGRFLIPGKFEPVGIHEVLGLSASFADQGRWVTEFESALAAFVQRDLDGAETKFKHVIHMRGDSDGPSEFYLKEIAKARTAPPSPEPWTGVVKIDAK